MLLVEVFRYSFFGVLSFGAGLRGYILLNLGMLLYSLLQALLVFGVKFQRLSVLSMRLFCFARL